MDLNTAVNNISKRAFCTAADKSLARRVDVVGVPPERGEGICGAKP
jgi:hypothetical protein